MSEKLNTYYMIYNESEDFYSPPMTKKQLLNSVELGLLYLTKNSRIIFDIIPIHLTEKQMLNKDYKDYLRSN